jgi:transposase InsO family protein
MCQVLRISRSGYYKSRKREASAKRERDEELSGEIRRIHEEHRGAYGFPRIHAELCRRGLRCGHKRVERLCQATSRIDPFAT